MTDHFDVWINGMTEEQYENWLDDEASQAQEEKALNIRTPLSREEEEDIEAEQVYDNREGVETPTSPSGVKEIQVLDTRDLPTKTVTKDITTSPTGAPIRISKPKIDTVKEVQQVIQQPKFREIITRRAKLVQSIKGFFARFRRKKE